MLTSHDPSFFFQFLLFLHLFVPNLSSRSTLEGRFRGKVPEEMRLFAFFRQNLSSRSTLEGRFRGKVPEEMPLFAFFRQNLSTQITLECRFCGKVRLELEEGPIGGGLTYRARATSGERAGPLGPSPAKPSGA